MLSRFVPWAALVRRGSPVWPFMCILLVFPTESLLPFYVFHHSWIALNLQVRL